MTTKKTAKKAPAKKKAAAKKTPAKAAGSKKTATKKKTVGKKVAGKKAPTKKKAPAVGKPAPVKYTAEQVYSMIEQAAYFAAENDGFSQDPSAYWAQAEASINSMING